MKKLIALVMTVVVVLSMTCVCMADDKGASCGATYHSILHYMEAYVRAPEAKLGCFYYVACELWNDTSRYSNFDGINRGKYISTTSRKQTAKTKSYSKSTRGYAVMYIKDSNGNFIKEATRKGQFYKS